MPYSRDALLDPKIVEGRPLPSASKYCANLQLKFRQSILV